MASRTYVIDDLERMLGVRARTIHSWVQCGLLTGPGAGRGGRYTDEHLGRLYLIKRLRGERRPLTEIAASVSALTPDQVRALSVQAASEWRAPRARSHDLVKRWLASVTPVEQRVATGESWTRVVLREDVELHIRQPLSQQSASLVQALLALG